MTIQKECRFAIHIPSKHPDSPDLHLIKEVVTDSEGKSTPRVLLTQNYKRPYWITKPAKRLHKQKKEWEPVDNLFKNECTQSQLRDKIAKALDKGWSNDRMRQLASSPYLYGTDISSSALIKKHYMDKWPNIQTPYSVATIDIETDVLNGTKDIIMATIVFENKIFTAVLKSFVSGISQIENRVDAGMVKYLGEYVTKRNFVSELVIADTVVDVIRLVINKAHEWKPDFLAIWNMDFDIPCVLESLELAKVDAADIFSDPIVPKEFRICKYKQGSKRKVTASGKAIPINPAAQWHTLISTSSFYVIDAMCVYKHLRIASPEESSYALDNILMKHLGIRKLGFKEADKYRRLKWHQFMQSEFKIEYIIYNRFDCISMLELDDVTKDLCLTLSEFAGVSDFSDFRSQPKRIADALHSFCLLNGKVIGTVYNDTVQAKPMDSGEEDEVIEGEEEDPVSSTLGLDGWIITLQAHMITDNGLKCISEDENLTTSIYTMVYDSDAVAAYPTVGVVMNVSKETTRREVIKIDGVDEAIFRMQNINLVSGNVNAIEYCTTMMNMPKPLELLEMYRASK